VSGGASAEGGARSEACLGGRRHDPRAAHDAAMTEVWKLSVWCRVARRLDPTYGSSVLRDVFLKGRVV
jgi:hypothetical protein